MDNGVGIDYGNGGQAGRKWMKGEIIGTSVKHTKINKKETYHKATITKSVIWT